MDKSIKTAKRVKDLGEVFTPSRIVNLMLDQPEIQEKVNSLTATFLEPSAGEGAFLVEILKRKLKYAMRVSNDPVELQINFLRVLSTLYGIELMEDNVEMLVINMVNTFRDIYFNTIDTLEQSDKVLKSANVIISANMAQGDTLTRKTATGDPIVFSEWKSIGSDKVQRTEYTFDSIIEGGGPVGTVQNQSEQLSLFSDPYADVESEEQNIKHYLPAKWENIYKQLVK